MRGELADCLNKAPASEPEGPGLNILSCRAGDGMAVDLVPGLAGGRGGGVDDQGGRADEEGQGVDEQGGGQIKQEDTRDQQAL